MAFIWKKHLSVGNALLDDEHKKLIGLINIMEYAVEKKDCLALLAAIRQFTECLCVHFQTKSRFARVFDFDLPMVSHQYLLNELQHTRDELEAWAGKWSEYVMDHYPKFLRDWLIGHITEEDMAMKAILQTHPYHFEPV